MPRLFRIVGLCQQSGIERFEIGLCHVDFAANLKNGGSNSGKLLRNIRDRPHIGGYILTHLSVTARCRLHQHAIFITQRTGQAVNLVLCSQGDLCIGGKIQETADPTDEILDILICKGIVEAHHPLGMGDLG